MAQAKIFGPGGPRADAATSLAVRVDWEDGRRGLLHLPEALTVRIRELPTGTWPQALQPADWAGLDFTWLTDLLAFDHWSLSADGPLRDQDHPDFFTAPIPNYVGLQSWAKLRLVKGAREGELGKASLEVRHLAVLVGSQGTLVGEMIRLALLRIDRHAWETSGVPIPEDVPTMPRLDEARVVGRTAPYYLYPGVPKAVQEKALARGLTKCSQVMEALGATVAFQDIVPAPAGQLDWLVAQASCDPSLAAKLRAGGPSNAAALTESFLDEQGAERFFPEDGGP